jgi:hypothetical protein
MPPVEEASSETEFAAEEIPQAAIGDVQKQMSGLLAQAALFLLQATQYVSPEERQEDPAAHGAEDFVAACRVLLLGATRLPVVAHTVAADWPAPSRIVLPSIQAAGLGGQTWAPVLAWVLLRALPWPGDRTSMFDHLHLRTVLAESFSALGMQGDANWRAAARVRILLAHAEAPTEAIASEGFWADRDARSLAGVNQSGGQTWFNKEQFEELWGWLQIPGLIAAAQETKSAVEFEVPVEAMCDLAAAAGYQLQTFLDSMHSPIETTNDAVHVAK